MRTWPNYFRLFRYFFLIASFICLTVYLVMFTPWHALFGRPRDYSPVVAEGDRLVVAIETFRREHGLWPEYLEDAMPAGWTAGTNDWFYDVEPVDSTAANAAQPEGESRVRRVRVLPSLMAHAQGDRQRTYVAYDFDPVAPTWRVFGGGDDRLLRSGAPAMTLPLTLPGGAAALLEMQLAELDRRNARDHGIIDHWRAKASLLVAAHRETEALQVIAAAGTALPECYWPPLAKAALDVDAVAPDARGRWSESADAFAEWVRARPSMTHAFYLSVLYRRAGKNDEALAAIKTGIAQAVKVAGDDDQVAAYYLWDMGRFALRQERWDLVIAISDAWQKAEAAGLVKDASCLALRAAARLANGDATGARSDLELLKTKGRVWAKSVENLDAAVNRGDRAYRYDPGKYPEGYAVFEVAE